ncbi:MAG: hypothetical protein JO301_16010, partial [Chitinophagaceae bacterium]|nr:hypothetical protein [Chitinophagaceae bacterium]
IAFGFGYLFSPVWEHEQVHVLMDRVLADIIDYYRVTAGIFTGKQAPQHETVLLRKNSWVSMANLSDAFTRMLSEPKSKQRNIEYIHQFVVAVHMLNSHIATLSYYSDPVEPEYISTDYDPLIQASIQALQQARQLLTDTTPKKDFIRPDAGQIRLLDQRVNTLVRKRQEELRSGQLETSTRKTLSEFKSITDQFYFIYKISVDVEKVCVKLSS